MSKPNIGGIGEQGLSFRCAEDSMKLFDPLLSHLQFPLAVK